MKNALKTVFNVAALAGGGGLAAWSGLGLVMGGWSTAGQPGGVDLNIIGVALCAMGAGLFIAGYRGVKNMAKGEANKDKNDQGPQPPAP